MYRLTKVVATARLGFGSRVKVSLVQSQEMPSFLCWSLIRWRHLMAHCQALFSNSSRPMSCLVFFSAASCLSTTTWVAMPAWSVLGSQRAGSPFMRCHRIMISSSVAVRACPRWSSPVTLGGGMMMVKGFFEWSILGVK